MRLIDADALSDKIEKLMNHYAAQGRKAVAEDYSFVLTVLMTAETIDPESLRPKGRWVLLDECSNAGVYCSVCHKKVYKEQYANQRLKSPYCPNCGAKMEG